MLKTLGSHVRQNVIGYIALFIALGGTTYAATGDNFILGTSNSATTPTQLSSGAANALQVTNTTAHGGVWASGGNTAFNAAAVHGESSAGNGVEGITGRDTASGVYGRSTTGTGVRGDSSKGWAFQALGNVTQTRAKGGFVKAMAFVDPVTHPSDPIQRCFNSQLPATQATSGNCGITAFRVISGVYDIGFDFYVGDRFALVSATPLGVVASVDAGLTQFRVRTWDTIARLRTDNPFYIAVY